MIIHNSNEQSKSIMNKTIYFYLKRNTITYLDTVGSIFVCDIRSKWFGDRSVVSISTTLHEGKIYDLNKIFFNKKSVKIYLTQLTSLLGS